MKRKEEPMENGQSFAAIPDAADNLSREEQEELIGVLSRRLREQRRAEIARESEEARREFQSGQRRPGTVEDIMQEILL